MRGITVVPMRYFNSRPRVRAVCCPARLCQPPRHFNSRPRVRAVAHSHTVHIRGAYFNSRPRVRAVYLKANIYALLGISILALA